MAAGVVPTGAPSLTHSTPGPSLRRAGGAAVRRRRVAATMEAVARRLRSRPGSHLTGRPGDVHAASSGPAPSARRRARSSAGRSRTAAACTRRDSRHTRMAAGWSAGSIPCARSHARRSACHCTDVRRSPGRRNVSSADNTSARPSGSAPVGAGLRRATLTAPPRRRTTPATNLHRGQPVQEAVDLLDLAQRQPGNEPDPDTATVDHECSPSPGTVPGVQCRNLPVTGG